MQKNWYYKKLLFLIFTQKPCCKIKVLAKIVVNYVTIDYVGIINYVIIIIDSVIIGYVIITIDIS